jgi:cytochrome c
MQTQKIVPVVFLVPLVAMLFGCQRQESAPQSGAAVPATQIVDQFAAGEPGATPTVSAEEATNFAKVTGCFECHSIEKKLLGPAWKHVAGVYRGDPGGEAKLMAKIAKGGSGVWGRIAMPAYPGLSEAELRMLARFILSLE